MKKMSVKSVHFITKDLRHTENKKIGIHRQLAYHAENRKPL